MNSVQYKEENPENIYCVVFVKQKLCVDEKDLEH